MILSFCEQDLSQIWKKPIPSLLLSPQERFLREYQISKLERVTHGCVSEFTPFRTIKQR